jgi:SAM-dependent methyltransferase
VVPAGFSEIAIWNNENTTGRGDCQKQSILSCFNYPLRNLNVQIVFLTCFISNVFFLYFKNKRMTLMDPESMLPLGRALSDYHQGEMNASLTLCRDDGFKSELPISVFFSELKEFPRMEKTALDMCRGKILDVGAGAGRHSLELQNRGFDVHAIDVCPEAVEIMKKRGVKKADKVDVYSMENQSFDFILLLMHGIGIAETENNAGFFLRKLAGLLKPGGQILLNSLDVRKTKEPIHLQYQQSLIANGKYRGDITLRLEYKGESAPWYQWLQLDPDMLGACCEKIGLKYSLIEEDKMGDYLAKISKV